MIAAGPTHIIAVTSITGGVGGTEIYTWGCGTYGQLGLGEEVYSLADCHVQTPKRVQVREERDDNYCHDDYDYDHVMI